MKGEIEYRRISRYLRCPVGILHEVFGETRVRTRANPLEIPLSSGILNSAGSGSRSEPELRGFPHLPQLSSQRLIGYRHEVRLAERLG